jgi:hypothetical protein
VYSVEIGIVEILTNLFPLNKLNSINKTKCTLKANVVVILFFS